VTCSLTICTALLMMIMSPFLDLPSELLIKILSHLDLQSLFASLKTCKILKSIYENSALLQYLAELEVAGMLDNPYCPLDTTQRLLMLREREEAWWSLEPQFTTALKLHARFSGMYDVSSSSLMLGMDVSEYAHDGGTFVQSLALPSPSVPPTNVVRHMFEAPHEPIDIGISIEENDLVALVVYISFSIDYGYVLTEEPNRDRRKHDECQLAIILQRHSTGEPHELAQRHTIPFIHIGQLEDTAIEISGSNLILTTTNRGGAGIIRVFDWMRGVLKGVCKPSCSTRSFPSHVLTYRCIRLTL
jgi:F-box domain